MPTTHDQHIRTLVDNNLCVCQGISVTANTELSVDTLGDALTKALVKIGFMTCLLFVNWYQMN